MAYPWTHFLGGHMGRVGTRDDVTLHQEYMADIAAAARKAIDPRPHAVLHEVRRELPGRGAGLPRRCPAATAAPVIEKYTGRMAAVDVFTASTAFWVMESIRLDLATAARCTRERASGHRSCKFHEDGLASSNAWPQAMEIVRNKDTGTLQFEISFNDDQSECIVLERYRDSQALIEHAEHFGDLSEAIIDGIVRRRAHRRSRALNSKPCWPAARSVSSRRTCRGRP